MTGFDEVLEWLNPSPNEPDIKDHLSDRIRSVIDQLRQPNLPNEDKLPLINRILVFSQSSLDEKEYPEALLHCAATVFLAGFSSQARDYLIEADSRYTLLGDTYRKAVTSCLRAMIELELEDYILAYSLFNSTRSILETYLIENNQLLSKLTDDDPDRKTIADWIERYVKRIFYLDSYLVRLPEEIYTWLNVFPSTQSHFQSESKFLRSRLLQAFQEMDYETVYSIAGEIEIHADRLFNHTETPELLVFAGMVRMRTGNIKNGVKDLRQAVEMFLPNSHQQCVARWMMGIAQWSEPQGQSAAIKNMELSIAGFTKLLDKADIRGSQYSWLWYSKKIPCMKLELDRRLRS